MSCRTDMPSTASVPHSRVQALAREEAAHDDAERTRDRQQGQRGLHLLLLAQACLDNTLRLETYIADAERESDSELAELFKKAQAAAVRAPNKVRRYWVPPWQLTEVGALPGE